MATHQPMRVSVGGNILPPLNEVQQEDDKSSNQNESDLSFETLPPEVRVHVYRDLIDSTPLLFSFEEYVVLRVASKGQQQTGLGHRYWTLDTLFGRPWHVICATPPQTPPLRLVAHGNILDFIRRNYSNMVPFSSTVDRLIQSEYGHEHKSQMLSSAFVYIRIDKENFNQFANSYGYRAEGIPLAEAKRFAFFVDLYDIAEWYPQPFMTNISSVVLGITNFMTANARPDNVDRILVHFRMNCTEPRGPHEHATAPISYYADRMRSYFESNLMAQNHPTITIQLETQLHPATQPRMRGLWVNEFRLGGYGRSWEIFPHRINFRRPRSIVGRYQGLGSVQRAANAKI